MSCKTIGLVLTDQGTDSPALEAALALALAEDAHLDAWCVGLDLTPLEMMPMAGSAMVLELGVEDARRAARLVAGWARTRLSALGARASVREMVMPQIGLAPEIGRVLRYCDLVVMGRPQGADSPGVATALVEAAILGARLPVLVVPATPPTLVLPFRRIMIAWDESDAALAATRRALPLLQQAESVDVVVVDPPSTSSERSDPGGELCVLLARHGVSARISVLARGLPRIADVLARFAREQGCDAIVMGAWGHSRLREALLGGVTRDMLARVPVPLLMAH